MKFLALIAIAYAAEGEMEVKSGEEKVETPVADPVTPPADKPGKASKGKACDSTKADMGCDDSVDPPLACQKAPTAGANTCIDSTTCGTENAGTKIECGAKALAASVAAVLAVVSTM